MKICIFQDRHPRAAKVAESLVQGAMSVGWKVDFTRDFHLIPRDVDLIACYGWKHQAMLEAYRKAGLHFLHVDLGYWNRKRFRSDYGGLHKIVLDARHATAYFRRQRPMDRYAADSDAPALRPWRENGHHIVLAGLSAKSAPFAGLQPMQWEGRIISELRKVTNREILYRPKPSDTTARPIHGTGYSPNTDEIGKAIHGAWALVTMHSNAAIDALAAGVPVHCEEGLASVMSTPLGEIETPRYPDDREQFFADVAYCHWTRQEIASGAVFRQFISDGLIQC